MKAFPPRRQSLCLPPCRTAGFICDQMRQQLHGGCFSLSIDCKQRERSIRGWRLKANTQRPVGQQRARRLILLSASSRTPSASGGRRGGVVLATRCHAALPPAHPPAHTPRMLRIKSGSLAMQSPRNTVPPKSISVMVC